MVRDSEAHYRALVSEWFPNGLCVTFSRGVDIGQAAEAFGDRGESELLSHPEARLSQGMLSVVYADGLGNPPALTLAGTPGYPRSLLLVDETGTPVARYTAGPVAQTRGVDLNEIVYGLGVHGL